MINDSALSINANEFVPSFPVSDVGYEAIKTSHIIEPESHLEPEPYLPTDHSQQVELHAIEHDQPLLAADPSKAHSIEEIMSHQQTECEIPAAPVNEAEPQSVITSSISDDKDAATNAAAAVTAAAVAGAAIVGAASVKAASSKAKPTDAKKVDSKLKAAPIKKTATTTTTTSKVAAARTSATKTDDKSKTAAPKIAARTVASKVGSTADKKPTVTSTVARKPASNGSKYHSFKQQSVLAATNTTCSCSHFKIDSTFLLFILNLSWYYINCRKETNNYNSRCSHKNSASTHSIKAANSYSQRNHSW